MTEGRATEGRLSWPPRCSVGSGGAVGPRPRPPVPAPLSSPVPARPLRSGPFKSPRRSPEDSPRASPARAARANPVPVPSLRPIRGGSPWRREVSPVMDSATGQSPPKAESWCTGTVPNRLTAEWACPGRGEPPSGGRGKVGKMAEWGAEEAEGPGRPRPRGLGRAQVSAAGAAVASSPEPGAGSLTGLGPSARAPASPSRPVAGLGPGSGSGLGSFPRRRAGAVGAAGCPSQSGPVSVWRRTGAGPVRPARRPVKSEQLGRRGRGRPAADGRAGEPVRAQPYPAAGRGQLRLAAPRGRENKMYPLKWAFACLATSTALNAATPLLPFLFMRSVGWINFANLNGYILSWCL